MTPITYWRLIFVSAMICATSSMYGEDLLFHTGPPVSTPSATPLPGFPEEGSMKLIKFQRYFFIDRARFSSLPESFVEFGSVSVAAAMAIELAQKNVDPEEGLRSFNVTEIKLLKGPATEARPVDYYLVSMLANGSEVHRVVLMNGDVIASKLREIKN